MDVAAHDAGEKPADREAETGAGFLAFLAQPLEGVEDALEIGGRDARVRYPRS